MSDEFDNEATSAGDVSDVRIYVVDPAEWKACIKQDSEKMYCYQKNPGEDYFHLIINGEVYLVRGDEKLCLRCALREGIATTDRLFWQHRVKPKKSSPL